MDFIEISVQMIECIKLVSDLRSKKRSNFPKFSILSTSIANFLLHQRLFTTDFKFVFLVNELVNELVAKVVKRF